MKQTGATAVGTALAADFLNRGVHAAGNDTLRIGVVGTGGRGTGAAMDAMAADPGVVVAALGDTFEDRARNSLKGLNRRKQYKGRIKVTDDTVFSGFDAYKKVIDSVDVVILTTPPHFRPEHFAYAVEKGKHCFVEKPVAVDAPGVRSVIETCKKAKEKNLSIVSGLCWRYDLGVKATMQQVLEEKAIGDIVAIESTYNAGTLWHRGDKSEWSRMEYQVRNWLYYTWLSGDHIVEQAIHSLDKCAWLMGDTQPIRATGIGGRQQRTDAKWGNIFDHHVVFFEYANDKKVFFTCRQQRGTTSRVDETVLGTEGQARIIGHRIHGKTQWRYSGPKPSMYVQEHKALFKSIRDGEPINNGSYMANSTMLAIMGRMCTYTGKTLTWDQCFNSKQRLGPENYAWVDVPEPKVAIPGMTKFS
jgi:predicted dehydrogenase